MPRSLRLVVSTGSHFAGDGLGWIVHGTLLAFHQAGELERVLAGRHAATGYDPRVRDFLPWPLSWLEDRATKACYRLGAFKPAHFAHAVLFDEVVSRRLPSTGSVFYGWQGYALRSLRVAKALGMVTVLECCNSHIARVQELLSRERARFGFGPSELTAWVRRLEAEYRAANLLLCPSTWVANSFRERGFAEDKLVIAPYGVDTERYRPGAPRAPTAPLRVVFAGDDMLRKGVPYLLEAWSKLAPADAELLLCGVPDPAVKRVFAGLASRAGMAPRAVREIGRVRDMPSVFASADLCVLPTLEDGFGLVILEAMAAGLPVIATSHSGGPDVIVEGQNGWLVPAGDVAALQAALARALVSRAVLSGMAERARATALENPWRRRSQALRERLQRLLSV